MQTSNNEQTLRAATTTEIAHAESILCWKSVFTGVLISLLAYFTLTALGAGIGGFRMAHIIETNENGSGLFTGAAIWLAMSSVVSLFLGSQFASRTSVTNSSKLGAAHGVVISAIFFAFLLLAGGNSFGSFSVLTSSGMALTQSDAEQAARSFGDTGWMVFISCLLGTAAAIFGGYEGAVANVRKPIYFRRSHS